MPPPLGAVERFRLTPPGGSSKRYILFPVEMTRQGSGGRSLVRRAGPFVALAVILGAFALAAVRFQQAAADLERARERMLAGDLASAEALFRKQERSLAEGTRARHGLDVVRALRGEAIAAADAPTLRWLGLEALLRNALAAGSLEGTAALARAAGQPLGAVYLSAVRLEGNDDTGATALAIEAPEAFSARGIGVEVTRSLDLRRHGAQTLVRDARGQLVGHVDEAGFSLAGDVDSALVPEALLRVLPAGGPAGLRLSLDIDLARLSLSALGAYRGSVVLLDPHTGAVRAAVSDTQTAARGGTPSFEERREPASIAKLVTTAAALRAGMDVDGIVSSLTCTGPHRVGRGIVWFAYPAGPLRGVEHAMAVELRPGLRRPRGARGTGGPPGRAAAVGLRRVGRGLSGQRGPRRGARRRRAAARRPGHRPGGDRHHAPARGAIGAPGRDRATFRGLAAHRSGRPAGPADRGAAPPGARDVLEPAHAAFLRKTMEAVAIYGTASGVAPPGYPVAMKTGTAAAWRVGYHVNYVGVAPSAGPEVAFCVRVTHASTSAHASRAGREVLASLLQGLADRSRRAQRTASARPRE